MRPATIFSALFLTAALALPLSSARADILISIDKSTQQMAVTVDGSQRYVWPVSTGRPGYDTPSGTFKINRMDTDHYSQEWDNAPMPHTMFFDLQGHAVHGFFDVKHLGLAVSHGCVRLAPENATVLFDLVKAESMANTTVVIDGRTPGGDNGPVARSRLTVSTQPQYGQQPQPYDRQQAQPYYSQQQPYYGQQTQQAYDQYGRLIYVQRYYVQPSYGQQGFPPQPQPYYGQPVYRQW
jgi:L,D-transpeptidase catalytic domain